MQDETDGVELVESTSTSNKKASEDVIPLMLDDDGDDDAIADGLQHPSHGGTASNAQVAVNIIISFVGAGLLGVPRAFSRAGWLLGSMALMGISALNIYAMLLLPKVRKHLQSTQIPSAVHDSDDDDEDNSEEHGGSGDAARDCNTYGGIGRILLGPRGALAVNVCLVISQVGFATAYIIFIGDSLESRGVARWKVCLGCIPGLSLLVQAKDMKSLSPFSLLANCSTLLGLSAVLYQDVERLEGEQQPDAFDHGDPIHAVLWGGMINVMAVTLYSMEGVGMILSLETSCRNTAHFPWLLVRVVGSITVFMCLFGSISYAAFGDDTLAPITLNLGQSSRAATLVQGALCVALYLTYPVMMFPVWTIAEEQMRLWQQRSGSNSSSRATGPLQRAVLRCSIVAVTALVAYSVPDFGDYLSLVGSSICNILGFIFPCTFHLLVFDKDLAKWERNFNYFIMGGAVLFGIMGTWQSFVHLMFPDSTVDGDEDAP